jgi:Holliday junction resolvase RusA-like endonuclease
MVLPLPYISLILTLRLLLVTLLLVVPSLSYSHPPPSHLHTSTIRLHSSTAHLDSPLVSPRVFPDISFSIPGDPLPLQRHRSTLSGHTYNPSAKAQKIFLEACVDKLPSSPLVGPIELHIDFYLARPKNHYRTGKFSHILKEDAPLWCSRKSDIDNLIKFVMDAINGVAYVDDKQVAVIRSKKVYDSLPRTEVTLKMISS